MSRRLASWRVAHNSKFDAAFMDYLLREHDAAFDQPHQSYYWLDVPSMAWMMGYRSLDHGDLGEQLGVEGKSRVPLEQAGLGCAEYNGRVYRALLAKQEKARSTAMFDPAHRVASARLLWLTIEDIRTTEAAAKAS